MDYNHYQKAIMMKLLYISGDYIKKSNYTNPDLQHYLQEFKLKLLTTTKLSEIKALNKHLNILIRKDIDNLLLLKLLHLINFQDSLNQHHSNRTVLNIINGTYSKLTSTLNPNKSLVLEKDAYILTLLIQNLYMFYTIHHQLNVEKCLKTRK
jgi:hypothetical protein